MVAKSKALLEADVAIVGAGLVGLTSAIALTQLDKRVVLVEANTPDSSMPQQWDSRIYALTQKTVAWLKQLGVWTHLNPNRINPITGMALFSPQLEPLNLFAEDAYQLDMGVIIESQHLASACWRCIEMLDITVLAGQATTQLELPTSDQQFVRLQVGGQPIQVSLMIGADGAQSWVRQQADIALNVKDFAQTAIVTNYKTTLPHRDTAYQWFGRHETLALLPMPEQQVSMVWALPQEQAQSLLALKPKALADKVVQRTQQALGGLKPAGVALGFPIKQQNAQSYVAPRLVLIGDSAHQVHPMAGQGVNLGFKDVMTLCEYMAQCSPYQSVGDAGLLKRYARSRKPDMLAMHLLTGGLDSAFAQPQAWLQHISILGIRGLQKSTTLKRGMISLANF